MKQGHAIKILLGLVIAVTLFHVSILLKILPNEITWGGRLTNDTEMYVFETFSIGLNLILGLALLIKGNYIKQLLPIKLVNVILWIFLFLFVLNTIGNLLAKTKFEKGFAIITLALALLLWIVLRSRKSHSTTNKP